MSNLPRTIAEFRQAYASGQHQPASLLPRLRQMAAADDHNCWIHLLSQEELQQQLDRLQQQNPDLPLYGIPFAIKDNLDLAGVPTTAACPAFGYLPKESAFVVEQLMAQGAVPLGKTNLDQFATGLVGTRSPWGPCHNAINAQYLSGGSSSGSAVATALGHVCFALGTDTAGSGRVPAMFNSLYGVKPSRGLISNRGMVPACASLDCVSIFARSIEDADTLLDLAARFDPQDPWSRCNPFANRKIGSLPLTGSFRFATPLPEQLEFFGDASAQAQFEAAIEQLTRAGGIALQRDFSCLFEAARLLYEGPWVAERYLAIANLIETKPESLHPVIRSIVEPARELDALSVFDAQYRLQACRARAEQLLDQADVLVTPTAPRCYRIDELLADPLRLNSNLGYYTNFMNLLDMAALAVPTGYLDSGIGFGITLFHRAFEDRRLLQLAARLQQKNFACKPLAPAPGQILLAVCGAHLRGQPLNWQLTERGATLVCATRTAPGYRLYHLNETGVKRPALVRDSASEHAIELEVWQLPAGQVGSFVQGIAPPLGLGSLQLESGDWVKGFICEHQGLGDAFDISEHGGWLAYLNSTAAKA